MIINFKNNISLLRLAGITKFICIDVHSDHVKFACIRRNEPFYIITDKNLIPKLEIIGTEYKEGTNPGTLIEKTLNDLIIRYNFNNAAVILGINDFRFSTVSIPADIEDIDIWFAENKNKFMPGGRPSEDFTLTYKLYREDENHKNFFVIVARNDFINSVSKSCKSAGLRVIGILPFPLTLFYDKKTTEKNILYIGFEKNKILYSFKSESGKVFYRDLFLEISDSFLQGSCSLETQKIDSGNLNFSLEEIKHTLALSIGTQFAENLNVFVSCHPDYYYSVVRKVNELFKPENMNPHLNKETQFYSGSVFAVKEMLSNFNTSLNIYNNGEYIKERFQLEKLTTLRITIITATVLIFLLISTYLAENYLTSKLYAEDENKIELSVKAGNIYRLKEENLFLSSNLNLLTKLKGSRDEYSSLLYEITKVVNSGCCLTGIILKKDMDFVRVNFTGLSNSQQDVAIFMSNLENSQKFREIILIYSTSSYEKNLISSGKVEGNEYIKFKIVVKYYADKK